jgi:hypothetical protein
MKKPKKSVAIWRIYKTWEPYKVINGLTIFKGHEYSKRHQTLFNIIFYFFVHLDVAAKNQKDLAELSYFFHVQELFLTFYALYLTFICCKI